MLRAVDVNVPVYAYVDFRDPRKTTIARKLMAELTSSGTCMVSTQVLKEFASVATSGRRTPALPQHATMESLELLMSMDVVHVDETIVIASVERHYRSRISFYDALIVEAAIAGGAEILYSEDLSHGQRFGSLRIENPFLNI